ncbi:MAG TPA: phosphoadenylyl-sulfate reductase [Balneolaceae bacterium]|nr:phosphoadenylyl-sulfate reductase [Balneolaceae bacterium]
MPLLINKEKINQSLSTKIVDARVAQIFNSFGDVLVTSSFGVTSAVLLHLVSRIKPECPIYFIDTGYHFEETLNYKKRLTRLLGLNVIDLRPAPADHAKTRAKKLWSEAPDQCCKINKIEPLQNVKSQYKVWMSGLLGYQNRHRNSLKIVDDNDDILRFYPLIDWNATLVEEYIESHGLPTHPLKEKGYHSVGCTHCTAPGLGRKGRWNKHNKTECGMHTTMND